MLKINDDFFSGNQPVLETSYERSNILVLFTLVSHGKLIYSWSTVLQERNKWSHRSDEPVGASLLGTGPDGKMFGRGSWLFSFLGQIYSYFFPSGKKKKLAHEIFLAKDKDGDERKQF